MYQILLGNNILYYPGNEEFAVFETELTEDVGQAGTFTFKVPSTNPLYGQIVNGALITILKDKKEMWRGEINDVSIDIAKIATVYCVEDLSWLADEVLPPQKLEYLTYSYLFEQAINKYNSSRGEDRRFTAGVVYAYGIEECNWQTEYGWSVLDCIRNCICRDKLYLRVRRTVESGKVKRYIDACRLADYGKATSQPIEYGSNLLDYVKHSDYENITNVLTPYGAELENDTVYDDYSKRVQGTTIQNQASIEKYGRHARAVIFDGLETVKAVNTYAKEYLAKYCQPQLTMEVNAIDLSVIENVEDMGIGDRVRIIAKPFNIDQSLYLTQIKRDLQNPDKNTLTLSGSVEKRTLTSQVINATDMIEEIPTEWNILKQAKKNALALLLDETQGGYVVFEYNENNSKMIAINICDAMTIEQSVKRWRWSNNGLGYMERKTTNEKWGTLKVAMTNAGSIVADRVDTGTLTAQIIKAGILQDVKKQFSLNMTTGDLTMNSGTFKGKLQGASGSFTGSVTATSGYIGNGEAGWKIESTNIHSKNGPAKIGGQNKNGTYVGVDGILNSDGASTPKYVKITGGKLTANAGKIGDFELKNGELSVGDALLSKEKIGCGKAGKGIVNIVGGQGTSGDEQYGYIQISNSGDPTECLDGIRIYGNGHVVRYNGSGNQSWDRYLSNIPQS